MSSGEEPLFAWMRCRDDDGVNESIDVVEHHLLIVSTVSTTISSPSINLKGMRWFTAHKQVAVVGV